MIRYKRIRIYGLTLLGLITIALLSVKVKKTRDDNSARLIVQMLTQAENYQSSPLDKAFGAGESGLKLALEEGNDTLAIELYLALGRNLSVQGKNKEAVPYFTQALKLSHSANYPKGECSSLLEMGTLNYDWGNYATSYNYFSKALVLAQDNKLYSLQADANNFIGKYYHTTGSFDKSVKYYLKAINIHQQLGNIQQSASVLLSIGKTYMNAGSFHKALECYLDAYKKGEQLNDLITLSDVCNHLGSIYLILQQPDKSLEYHRKALSIRTSIKNMKGMAVSHNNLGETFLSLKKNDSAQWHFEQSLRYCRETGYKKGTVKALTNIGNVYTAKNLFQKAGSYLRRAFEISRNAGYDAGIAESSLALGNNMLAQHLYDNAIPYYQTSLTKAEILNLTEVVLNANQGLYQCYLNKQNLSQALHYYIQLSETEKKKLLAENNQQLSELRVTFESEKKEKDNQFLRKENELNEMSIMRKSALMWLFLIALAFTVLLCILIYVRFEVKRKANNELKILNEKILQQNREYDKLNKDLEQANQEKDKILSIIAHELRNPLFWFQNLAEVLSKRYQTMSMEKIQKSLTALDESAKNAFHLMDNLLHWSRSRLNRITPKKTSHSLDKLIQESARMYETILQQKEINLITEVPTGTTVTVDPDLFTCVVRNIVSNAIKYTPAKGNIEIACSENKSEIRISITDSGIGISDKNIPKLFDPDQYYTNPGLMQEKGSGFGLKLCKEFTELNGGKIWVSSETGKGTRFEFTVPRIRNIEG